MKILTKKYPKGSYKGQQTDGRYFDETLYENLRPLAEKITDDMTFLAICSSSTLEVGTGKSVFMTQIGEAWCDLVNQIHGTNLEFTMKNIVFRPKDLIKRAFEVPKYACVLVDEWEDAHYWSELGISLRQFFRKCRQLNLFIIVIIPNFFQLPMPYAVSRSVCFIDVRFEGKFERGFFRFYNFKRKRELYIKGKKYHDYNVCQANFTGRFLNGYGVPDEEYRKAKYEDMLRADDEEKKKQPSEKEIKVRIFKQFRERLPELTIKRLSEGFAISERTAYKWMSGDEQEDVKETNSEPECLPGYNTNLRERDTLIVQPTAT